jgi:hypothetical protein
MNSVLDLGRMDASTFEQMINALGLGILGYGLTSFGPGPDGGRDGFFEGTAPYPSTIDAWSGTWYLQSKYHAPNQSSNHHEWLVEQVRLELQAFEQGKRRRWPDIWILATNIDPSGVPETGAFDRARTLVRKSRPELAKRFAIWGGKKILDLLDEPKNRHIAERYGQFLTPGHVIHALVKHIDSHSTSIEDVVKYLIGDCLIEERHARLGEIGDAGRRPDVHELFIDLPYRSSLGLEGRRVLAEAAVASAEHYEHTDDPQLVDRWKNWQRELRRCAMWLILAGPGKGKTTIGQMLSQIHRAALVLDDPGRFSSYEIVDLSRRIRERALELDAWPAVPRIPIRIDLSQYADWYIKEASGAKGVLSFIGHQIHESLEEVAAVSLLKRCLSTSRWILLCDGLDEVPSEMKRNISKEIIKFSGWARRNSDLLMICTSRPQGYDGQLDELDGATLTLSNLNEDEAMNCARRLLASSTNREGFQRGLRILSEAMKVSAVRQLMVTPLQTAIMTIIVRQGHRPPTKKWLLFRRFYIAIYGRETTKDLGGAAEAALLRNEEKLILIVHRVLGFVLHARAETTAGALSSLPQRDFRELVKFIVSERKESRVDEICNVLCRTATDRLVLISTPDNKESVRFDIRQLQEFFAAEFLSEGIDPRAFRVRLGAIVLESHWREVVHFMASSVIENEREAEIAIVFAILQNANEECIYGDGQALGSQALVGSLIAAHLLIDGVLEHDKKLRNLFRPLIQRLVSSHRMFHLQPLLSVEAEESHAWLLQLIREHISQWNESFCIGATSLLFWMSPVDVERVADLWAGWQSDNLNRVLDLVVVMGGEVSTSAPSPLMILIKHPKLGCLAGLHFLESHWRGHQIFMTAVRTELGVDVAQMLDVVLSRRFGFGKPRDLGWVLLVEEDPDMPLNTKDVAVAQRVVGSETNGFIALCARLVLLRAHRSRAALIDLLSMFEEIVPKAIDRWVRRNIAHMLDRPDVRDMTIDELRRMCEHMDDDEFVRWMTTDRIEDGRGLHRVRNVEFHGKCGTPKQALELIDMHQGVAWYLFKSNPAFVAALLSVDPQRVQDLIENNLEIIATDSSTWAVVEPHYPRLIERLGTELVDARCGLGDPYRALGHQLFLDVKSDANLLCPVATSLVGRLGTCDESHREIVGTKVLGDVQTAAARWVQDVARLGSLIISEARNEVKFAATIIGVLHPAGGSVCIHQWSEMLLSSISDVSDDAIVGLVRALDSLECLSDERCRRFVDSLVAARPNADWTELALSLASRSVGKVARSGHIPLWLGAHRGPEWLVEPAADI